MTRKFFFGSTLILISVLVSLFQFSLMNKAAQRTVSRPDVATQALINQNYGKLPLSFEVNQGQTDKQVKFLSRGNGYNLFLTPTEAVLALKPGKEQSSDMVLRMQLKGSNTAPQVIGLDELPGKSNYFIGNDPQKWRTNVSHYAKVRYREVYPGVDLIYYGNQRQLEYDFVVAPGADPKAVMLGFEGTDNIEIDGEDNLALHTAGGQVRLHKPIIYQETNGEKQFIAGNYVFKGETTVGFEVAAYDGSKPLIIDPVLSYSTYLGGGNDDQGRYIALDSGGNILMVGITASTNFPTVSPLQASYGGGGSDALVLKLNPAGSELIYSTYLGGSGSSGDGGFGIAVDSAGNAYVTGNTYSVNFPTTALAFDISYNGGSDAFVTKLNASGNALVYSTYLGSSGHEGGGSIALDSAGNAYVAGSTGSSNFPTTSGAFRTAYAGGTSDAFVAKLNTTGSALVYSTYVGGSGFDAGSFAKIALDSSGNAYITGDTSSSNFPTTIGAFQTSHAGGEQDTFVTKLNPTGSALVYSTYLGGSGDDPGTNIAVDASGQAYVVGYTSSANFPTVGPFQAAKSGGFDVYAAKLNSTGSALLYSTYLGGSGDDTTSGMTLDSNGNSYVTGYTSSANFPTARPIQAANGGGLDCYVAKLNSTGSALLYSTYLGGSSTDAGSGIAVDTAGNAFVTGTTSSSNFPTLNPLQAGYGGSSDAFIAKITELGLTEIAVNPNTNKIYVANSASNTILVIDGSDDSLLTTIPVSLEPRSVGVNPITNKIYVGHSASSNRVVTVIDGNTDTVIKTISTGDAQELNSIAVNPNTNTIYVTSRDPGGRVVKIDGATDSFVGFISVAENPSSIGVNPNTNKIYVGHGSFFGRDRITIIDGATDAVSDGPVVGLSQLSIDVNPTTNRIYVHVGNPGPFEVKVIDGSTDMVAATIPLATGPGEVRVNPTCNRVYVSRSPSNDLLFIDGATNMVVDTVPAGPSPASIGVNSATGKIYVVNTNVNTVSVLEDSACVCTAPQPNLSVNDVIITEGDSGTTSAVFTVTLSAAHCETVTVNYATADGTATAGSDYQSTSGTLTFNAGETQKTINVMVNGDILDEADETFLVNLSSPTNATIADGQGIGTISDNDPAPNISINNATFIEGDSGTTVAIFVVSLSAPSGNTVTVPYSTSDGTAIAGTDYSSTSGTLTFDPGVTTMTVNVPVVGDILDEDDETLFVNIANPQNGTIADGQAVGTIIDDDPPPALSINDPAVTEGDSGTTTATFTVSLSAASGKLVTVSYTTTSGTATEGSDYLFAFNPITFNPGETEKAISITVNGDTNVEFDETFLVVLVGAVNATILDLHGQGTILNDDLITLSPATLPPGRVGMAYNETITASNGTAPYVFTLESGTLPVGLTLSFDGVITGTPNMSGSFAFSINARDANGFVRNQPYQIDIAKADTSTNATSSPNPSVFGQSVTFTATVSVAAPGTGTLTGTIAFKENGNTIGTATLDSSGLASFTTSSLTAGSHQITAVYNGDGNFNGSTSATLTQIVNLASTTTTIESSLNPSASGDSVTFTATVSVVAPGEGSPSGTVAFKDGSSTIGTGTLNSSGVATFTTTSLSAGSHSISAEYLGNSNFNPSASATLSQTVLNTPTGSDIMVDPVDSTTGASPISLTFSNITQSGETSLTTSSLGPPPPSGFRLGNPPTFYELSTTAVFSGPVEVCIDYTGTNFRNESQLKLFHFENGAWVDRTTMLNTTTNIICASVTSFSPFALFAENAEPTVNAGGPYSVDEGSSINVTATGSDIDDDVLIYRWDLDGDGVFETTGQTVIFSAAALDGPSSRTIKAQVTDSLGLTAVATTTVNVLNVKPTINTTTLNANPIFENGSVELSVNFSDPGVADTHPVIINWGDGSPDTSLSLAAGIYNLNVTHIYLDDNPTGTPSDLYNITVTVMDDDGGTDGSATSIIVNNAAPVITSVTGPGPLALGTAASVTINIADPGSQDTFTAVYVWDDGTTSTLTGLSGSSFTAAHTYTASGVYTIQVTVTDDDTGNASTFYQFVVIYDPEGGFVTGGGFIISPAGALESDSTLTGKANFGFNSKYHNGATVPTGNTEFQFKAGNFNFKSTVYDFLVVAGHKAQFRGSGKVNGTGDYSFILTVVDGDKPNGGGTDKFRIKIVDKSTNQVVYDNKRGESDDIDQTDPQAIGGGSITIHNGN
jgi:YVTN family beta-propeller protein